MFSLYCFTTLGLVALATAACIHAPIILENDVTPDDRDLILNKHNFVRDLVSKGLLAGQPKAINLNPLVWDDKLAESAQLFTSYAGSNDTAPPDDDDRFEWIGKNIVWWGSDGYNTARPDWEHILDSWFGQNQNFLYPNSTTNDANGDSVYYLQMVSAKTQYVGCGYVSYFGSDVLYNKEYACYYGPGGPDYGEPPYEIE